MLEGREPTTDEATYLVTLLETDVLEGPSHLSRRPIAIARIHVEGTGRVGYEDRVAAALERQALPAAILPLWPEPSAETGNIPRLVANLALALQRATGLDLLERGVAFLPDGQFLCYTEQLVSEMAVESLKSAAELVSSLDRATDVALDAALSLVLYRLRELRPTRMASLVMQKLNKSGFPWRVMERNYWTFEIGYGAEVRRLRNTSPCDQVFSSQKLCENKATTSQLLRAAGLPAPEGELVSTIEEALAAASRLTYPVVTKIRDGSMGAGVGVDLRNDRELMQAFEQARALSPYVVVERFIVGRPYRLYVIDHRLVHAIQRSVPEVVGDGRASVEELIERMNAEPQRRTNDDIALCPFDRDEDPLSYRHLLEQQGLQPQDIPEAGQVVQLGYMPIHAFAPYEDVLDRIHPAVVEMAESAAAVLNLATAGIDYLSPDISEPPEKRNSGINEVNMAPWVSLQALTTSGSDFIAPVILPRLGARGGRIPLCALSSIPTDDLADSLAVWMGRAGMPAGVGSRSGARLADGRPLPRRPGRRPAVQLLADPRVEAAVLQLDDRDAVESGLPFDLCDLAVLGRVDGNSRTPQLLRKALLHVTRKAVVAPYGDDFALPSGAPEIAVYLVSDRRQVAVSNATVVWPQAEERLVLLEQPDGWRESIRLPAEVSPDLAPWLVAALLGLGLTVNHVRRLFSSQA